MLSKNIIFAIFLWLSTLSILFAQNNNCDPTAVDTSAFEGTAYFNYGSVNKSKTTKYKTASAIGQTITGFVENDSYTSNLGFYGRFLLPPFKVNVNATQGDLLDRIQLTWQIDALGPSPNEGFNIYRDNIFLATVGPSIRNYNDFNVIAGVAYTYTVSGLNGYGEGSPSEALGFQVPNGVVTGWVQTRNGNPVPNALVTLMPMQGFSAKFGVMDGASAAKDTSNAFMPISGNDWTMTFWIKTNTAAANGSIIHLDPIPFYVKALPSTSGNEGIEIATSATGGAILSATFPDSTKNGWHHVALSWNDGVSRLYIDGVLNNQASLAPIGVVDTLLMGAKAGIGGWDGYIDEFRIYDRQLDELDLLEVMEGTASSQTPFLSHYWKMDEELGEKSYDLKKRHKLYFCGARFDIERPPVRTAGMTNEDGYYRIESASYGTGTTFLAQPMKSFYLHKSVKFSPSDMSYATLPDFGLTKKSTIETWINTTGSINPQTILHKKWGSNECQIFLQPLGLSSELKVTINGTTNTFGIVPPDFQHLAFTIDSITGSVVGYLNGNLMNTHNYGVISGNWSDPLQPWTIGAKKNGNVLSEFFSGLIDEVAFYDTTLTVTQILTHSTNSRDMREEGLRQYFPMDEGNGIRLRNVGTVFIEPGTLYNSTWSSFAPNQVVEPHEFLPKTRQVTLNPSVTSVDQVDFTDKSTVEVSGFVRYANTNCFAENVEILVNGSSYNPQIFTDSVGKFVVDFDPGASVRLTPKFEDHEFVPQYTDINNITSPIAGVVFNNTTYRTIEGRVYGGLCKRSIIKEPAGTLQGTICVVKIASVDGCYERIDTIDNTEGDFVFNNIPPFEKLTVAVIEHSNPRVKDSFQKQGGYTVDLSKIDTTAVSFVYFADPIIDIISGLETYSPTCDVIVLDKGENKQIQIKLKEVYEDGTCDVDTAGFRIINGFSSETIDTAMSNGLLTYTFKVGDPNPTPPYFKTMQIISTTIEGNRGELTKQAIVTGIRAKDNTFTTILPETPSIVLRDPPGDGSFAYIKKDQNFCQTMSFNSGSSTGKGARIYADVVPDLSVFIKIIENNIGPDVTIKSSMTQTSSNSVEICHSLSRQISTSQDDLIVGEQGGDIFVGGALNIEFGNANIIEFDTTLCVGTDSAIVIVTPGDYATTFMYSEWYIKNTVLYNLGNLKQGAINEMNFEDSLTYHNSIVKWNKILNDNDAQKENTRTTENLSFDAGVSYEYSITSDTTTINEQSTTNEDSKDIVAVFEVKTPPIGIGAGVNAIVNLSSVSGSSSGSTQQKGVTTGYVLADDDVLDAFSVNIGIDSVYKTPVFKVKAGQSSCPWEPGTAKREGVLLTSVDGPVRTDVPANEPAVFHFIMGNTSATNETWTYAFTAGPESNTDGAKIFCNGAPMNQIQWYAIPWGTSIPVTVTVERGPQAYNFDSLEIVLYSACEDQRANDLGILPDTAVNLYSAIYVSAYFIKPCSEVNINVPEPGWVIKNSNSPSKGITTSGYDLNVTDFEKIIVQYRRKDGDGAWLTIQDTSTRYNPNWSGFNNNPPPNLPYLQNDFTNFIWETDGLEDDEYEIRAVSYCTGDSPTGYSEIISGKIDRQPPALLGRPQPSDGVYHVGDEISFTFNKAINCGRVAEIVNVELFNAETDSLINISLTCHDNKIMIDPLFINSELENKILRAELHNIPDLTGNIMLEAEWEFYVDRNELAWLDDTVSVVKYDDEVKSITVNIQNRGGYPVPYSLQNIPSWMKVYPVSGTLVANETEEITIEVSDDVPLGNYFDSIILRTETGLNPFFMGGDEVLIINTRVICRPPVWVIDPAAFDASPFNFSMNYILKLNIEGTLSTDTEDIVGAYVDGELRGVSKVQYKPGLGYVAFLTAYSNVTSGETVDFQIWDASDCQLYADIIESFPFVDNTIIGNTITPQIIHTSGKLLRKIYIKKGWNWISFNLDPLDPAINGTLESLSDPAGATIKGQSSFSQYSTNLNIWAGSLTDLGPGKMYQYYSQVKDSISLIGTHIDSLPIPISQGWNWIGYMPTYKLPVNTVLSTLQPSQGDIIKGQLTFAVYDTNLGWVGNLTYMNEPNGYLLKSNTIDTLIYPNVQTSNVQGSVDMARVIQKQAVEFQLKHNAENPSVSRPLNWELDPSQYEYTMNVIAYVVDNEDRILLKENDEIGLFVNDELRGNGRTIYIPAIDKYILFVTAYANKNGEQIHLKYYSAVQDKVFDIKEKMTFNVNDIIGAIDSPTLLHLAENVSSTSEDISNEKLKVYPNPFSSTVNIDWQGGLSDKTEIKVTNSLGELIHVFCCDQTNREITFVWKPDNSLSAGTYIIQVITTQEVIQKKVIFIK
ncbi:MAG TPA: LamG-like jellyroll fold domain-containing protein [Saprospiraceae bacterium]|nr:LamG-like jellyroll fold domain-containing protein [Saprospiraceae bacterium]